MEGRVGVGGFEEEEMRGRGRGGVMGGGDRREGEVVGLVVDEGMVG